MDRTVKPRSHPISGIFVFLLLGIFALLATAAVLFGARAYRGVSARAEERGRERIAASYLRSMARSADASESAFGGVRIDDISGMPCLTLENMYDGETYLTRIYVYEGELREWFAEEGLEFLPEDGEAVCAADEMRLSAEGGGLLCAGLRFGEKWIDVRIALRAADL